MHTLQTFRLWRSKGHVRELRAGLWEGVGETMSMIAVIGTGYVGLVTGAWFAELGNHGHLCGHHRGKDRSPSGGRNAVLSSRGWRNGDRAIRKQGGCASRPTTPKPCPMRSFVFITVDTPPGPNGKADMSRVESASRSIAQHLKGHTVIINKSTMPMGSGDFVAHTLEMNACHRASRSPWSRTRSSCARALRCVM